MVNEYNNEYHSTIKMKPVYVKSRTYIDSIKEINDKDSEFKIGDIVGLSQCKNIFEKGYTLNQSEEVFAIEKIKNIVLWTYVINELNGVEIVNFYENKLQKKNKSKRIQN